MFTIIMHFDFINQEMIFQSSSKIQIQLCLMLDWQVHYSICFIIENLILLYPFLQLQTFIKETISTFIACFNLLLLYDLDVFQKKIFSFLKLIDFVDFLNLIIAFKVFPHRVLGLSCWTDQDSFFLKDYQIL